MFHHGGQIGPELPGAGAYSVLNDIDAVLILACGTSDDARVTAKYWLEAIAGIPCQVEIASEYRWRDSVPNPCRLVVMISRSGETADTIAALEHASALGQARNLAKSVTVE